MIGSCAGVENLDDKIKKVGAHSPTKTPKRSACARVAGVSPLANAHISIDPIIEAKPA